MNIDGRSVLGYFDDQDDAEKAKERLIAAGFPRTGIDVARRGAAVPSAHDASLAGGAGFTSDQTHEPAPYAHDGSILLAADPALGAHWNGYSTEGAKPGTDWLVVTVTDGSDTEVERAVQIIKHYGGDV